MQSPAKKSNKVKGAACTLTFETKNKTRQQYFFESLHCTVSTKESVKNNKRAKNYGVSESFFAILLPWLQDCATSKKQKPLQRAQIGDRGSRCAAPLLTTRRRRCKRG